MGMRIAEGFFFVVMIGLVLGNKTDFPKVIAIAGRNYANLVKGLEGRV
jgi:hypothetical protein